MNVGTRDVLTATGHFAHRERFGKGPLQIDCRRPRVNPLTIHIGDIDLFFDLPDAYRLRAIISEAIREFERVGQINQEE